MSMRNYVPKDGHAWHELGTRLERYITAVNYNQQETRELNAEQRGTSGFAAWALYPVLGSQ